MGPWEHSSTCHIPIQEQCATELLHTLTHEIGPDKLHGTRPITEGQTHEVISPLRNTLTYEIGPDKLHGTRPITEGQTHEVISPLRNALT